MIVKTVGRSQDNNIVINDAMVSRTHLQMVRDDQGITSVVDLGSANGTFVNGKRISGETRLNPGDELRIGNTVLNWQQYFADSPISKPATSIKPSDKPIKGSNNKAWIYIVFGILILLIIGCILFFNNKKDKSEKVLEQQVEEEEYRDLERDALTADLDAARAAKEYEEALKKAAQSKSIEDQRIADSLKDVSQKAKAKAEEISKANKKLEAEKKQAQKDKDAAERRANEAEASRSTAEKERNEAQKKATAARDSASQSKQQADLTSEFYEQLNKARKENRLKAICQVMDIKDKKKEDAQYEAIVKRFKAASDNTARNNIIKIIKSTKNNSKNNNSKNTPEEKNTNIDNHSQTSHNSNADTNTAQ